MVRATHLGQSDRMRDTLFKTRTRKIRCHAYMGLSSWGSCVKLISITHCNHGDRETLDDLKVGEEVLRNIRRITRAIDLSSKKLAQTYGLTGPQSLIMQEIDRKQPIPISTLAARVSLSHATVTDILNRLFKRGLVMRVRDEKDKRRVLASLTEAGHELISKLPPLLQEEFMGEFNKLKTWEKHMILASLSRVAAFMDSDKLDAAPILTAGPVQTSETDLLLR